MILAFSLGILTGALLATTAWALYLMVIIWRSGW